MSNFNMRLFILIASALFSFSSYSQEYIDKNWKPILGADISILFNPNSIDNPYFNSQNHWVEPTKFVLAGIAAQYEYGMTYKEWFRVGAHLGLQINIADKTVTTPIGGSISLAPLIGEDTRLYGKFIAGWNIAIGKGNKNGMYQHYQIGIESQESIRIFAFIADHGFSLKQHTPYTTMGLGIGGTVFD